MELECAARIRDSAAAVAARDTAYDPLQYDASPRRSPLVGHCFVCALIVQDALGGHLVRGRVNDGGTAHSHYWNELPSGIEVDITSDQFGGDGITPLVKGSRAARPATPNPRYVLLKSRIASKETPS
jgi:hypothetical protein